MDAPTNHILKSTPTKSTATNRNPKSTPTKPTPTNAKKQKVRDLEARIQEFIATGRVVGKQPRQKPRQNRPRQNETGKLGET